MASHRLVASSASLAVFTGTAEVSFTTVASSAVAELAVLGAALATSFISARRVARKIEV